MATIPYFSQRYSYPGPRQGVYISPAVRWRGFQFKNPDESYKHRERLEPQADTHSKFPARIVKRRSSVGSVPTSTTARSSAGGCNSTSAGAKTRGTVLSGKSSSDLSRVTSSFALSAQAALIRPKPQRRHSSFQLSHRPQTAIEPDDFSYPDPTTMKGDPCFDTRMAELAKLEGDTIKLEDWRARISARAPPLPSGSTLSSRPASARGLHSSRAQQPTSLPSAVHTRGSSATVAKNTRPSSSRSNTARSNGSVRKSVEAPCIQRSVSACNFGTTERIRGSSSSSTDKDSIPPPASLPSSCAGSLSDPDPPSNEDMASTSQATVNKSTSTSTLDTPLKASDSSISLRSNKSVRSISNSKKPKKRKK